MLAVISPAKSLDFSPVTHDVPRTKPLFPKDTEELIEKARGLKAKDLKKLMGISDKLADLNVDRFQSFDTDPDPRGAKQAILAFKGDTYIGFDAGTLSDDDLKYAQDHLRILSGLYGVLRPLDALQPYRLEMGTKFKTERGKTLYDFWGKKIAQSLNDSDPGLIINLASNEYWDAVDKDTLRAKVITPVFKEVKDGKARTLGLFAKRARGMMARYIVENRVKDEAALKKFNAEGYEFQPDLSDETTWQFHRPQPKPKSR
ncbi:MAG: peroxide stress protein YaaA [Alphaproteobacteria bacterium]|nr:peroxide stress protein YaaA [Alphaproteobacteria bacterium]